MSALAILGGAVSGAFIMLVFATAWVTFDTRRKTRKAFQEWRKLADQETSILEQFNERIIALEVTEIERAYLFGAEKSFTSTLASERYKAKHPDRYALVTELGPYKSEADAGVRRG